MPDTKGTNQTALSNNSVTQLNETARDSQFEIPGVERHIARMLIALYHLGTATRSLWDGETRQVDSIRQLQQFEFWLREPGHLALALLHIAVEQPAQTELIRITLDRILTDRNADRRRVIWPGTPYQTLPNLNESFTFLSSRGLVSDRPSFTPGRTTRRIVLESPGVVFCRKIVETCPSFVWYDWLGETVVHFWSWLESIDLTVMPHLSPDLTPTQAAIVPLMPIIKRRYENLFTPLESN